MVVASFACAYANERLFGLAGDTRRRCRRVSLFARLLNLTEDADAFRVGKQRSSFPFSNPKTQSQLSKYAELLRPVPLNRFLSS
jgi:hypothetical protein